MTVDQGAVRVKLEELISTISRKLSLKSGAFKSYMNGRKTE